MTKLKVTLVFGRCEIHDWKYELIEEIKKSDYISLHSIICLSPIPSFYNLLHRLKSTAYLLFRLSFLAERKIFDRKRRSVNSRILESAGVPCVPVKYRRKASGIYIHEPDLNRIGQSFPHIILDLSPGSLFCRAGSLSGHQFKLAEYGLWFFRFSRLKDEHFPLAGFWENMTNKGELFGSLGVLNRGEHKILYKTFSYLHPYSHYKSVRNHYFKLSDAFFRQARLFAKDNYVPDNSLQDKSEIKLSSWSILFLNLRLFTSYASRVTKLFFNFLYTKTWTLLYIPVKTSADLFQIDFDNTTEIVRPGATDWADPFIITSGDKPYIFYEEIQKKVDPKGHICCAEFNPVTRLLTNNQIILKENFHISFPFVFNYENRYYMIPESMAGEMIAMYECIEFPYNWKFRMNMMENVRAADTVVHYKDGYWWLFTTLCNSRMDYNYDELHLFYSPDLFGKWTPHPMNPVVSDVKSARCAGEIFSIGNKLIRPSQNCQYRYGYGLNLNEIKTLSLVDYKEEQIIGYSSQDTRFNSIHTLNGSGRIYFSDVKKFIK